MPKLFIFLKGSYEAERQVQSRSMKMTWFINTNNKYQYLLIDGGERVIPKLLLPFDEVKL